MDKRRKKLLKAVFPDLQVPSFVTGSGALGLVDKLVTSSLWHAREHKGEGVVDMSVHYQGMLSCFERWSLDAVSDGEARLFDNESIDIDKLFIKLHEPSEYWDGMTKQCLELYFGSFLIKTNKMLADHFKGGKYDQGSVSVDVREESKGVLKTNVVPERGECWIG